VDGNSCMDTLSPEVVMGHVVSVLNS
jgi:hypothetical protein